MRTKNIWKSLLMSAALLVSGAMVSCEKDQDGHPIDFDAQITASPELINANLGETVAITVVSNTDWVLEPTTHRLLIDDCDAYAGEEGTTTVHIKLVPEGDQRLEDDSWTPGSALKLDFQAIGYVQGLKFTRHAYVDVKVGIGEGDIEHAGTLEDPLSPENANTKCSELGSGENSATSYYIKGIVTSVKEAYTTTYGNATFYIGSTVNATETFYVYRAYYFDNKKYTNESDANINVGDEVIVYGQITNYNGTYETVQNGSFLYSLNGVTGSEIEQPEIKDSADVTLPYALDTTGSLQGSNNAYASSCDVTVGDITWNFEGNTQINPWRLGGKNLDGVDRAVYTKTAMNADVKAIELTHGAATVDNVNSLTVIVAKDKEFTNVVSTLNPAFAASTTTTIEKPADADWNGCYYKFIYNVTAAGDSNKYVQFSKVVFTDGNGGGTTEPEPETPIEAKAVTVAEFNAAEESQTQVYQLTGVVSGSINTTYGNFDLVDETGSVYVYGLSTGAQSWGSKTDQTFGSMGIVAGDKIKINGYRGSYNDKIEVMYAWLVEIVEKGSTEPGTGTDPVEPTPTPTPDGAKVDILNQSWSGITGTTYTALSDTKGSASNAVYTGMCAGDKNSIQLRSATDKNYSGIVTKTSGGKVLKVYVKWVDDTAAARVLDVYGKNEAYTAAEDLYSGDTQGTKIASFTKSEGDKEITIEGDYSFIGFRSNSGALYLDEVQITWAE